jgi:hypothetical protein
VSNAIKLYKQDGTTAGIFYCSECRCVYKTESEAANCHGEKTCACGKVIERRFYEKCNACDDREWREKRIAEEFARFEKAKKITDSEYTGDMISDGENFYSDLEDALDRYLEGQEPEYLWACKDVGVPKASAEGIYDHLLENMWEDADVNDLCGIDELEAAIAAFNEANKEVHVYQVDYSTAILVNKVNSVSAVKAS